MRQHVRMRVCTRTDAYAHCWEYFVTMKLLQLSTNSSGVLFLLLELVLCLLPLAASSVKLHVIDVTNATNVLQQYLGCGKNDQQIPNNTVLQLVSPSYVLNASGLCLVSNRHNIGIVSKQQAVITCTTNTGIGFVNVNVLNISNVTMMDCGAPLLPLTDRICDRTGPYLSNTSYASLAIVDSSEVSLSSVTIWEYYGYAILVVNVYGVSNLSQLEIVLGNAGNFDGIGVMIYYHNNSKPSLLTIANSQFASNQLFNSSICFPEFLSPLSDGTPIPTPYATALSIVYNQVSQNVSVTINSCFFGLNTGSPVVLILYYDSLPNVTTAINGTEIIENQEVLSNTCHGTGFAMVTYFSKYFAKKYEKSHMSITNDWTSLSISQTSINSGMFNSERQSVLYLSTSQINQLMVHVVFQNVQFQYNSAAEVVYAETISTDENIKSLAVHFTDVVVSGNVQNRVTKDYWYMPGAILTFVDVAAVYLSDSNFTRNIGSVIEAYDTDVYMSGNVSFQYNSGSNGAALLLLGQSYLFLYPNLSANFKYNTYKYGGAIYSFNNKISSSNSYCTFQVLSSNLSEVKEVGPLITFVDNIANIGQNYVSAISIDECQQIQLHIDPGNLYGIIFLFDDDYINDEYYSKPARIMPCVNGNPNHNFSSTFSTYPGKNIKIGLAALDGNGANIATSVQVKLFHGQNYQSLQPSSWWLSDCEKEQILNSSVMCTNISLTIHTKQVNINRAVSTALFSFPDDVPTFQSEIILEQCPKGFELDNHTGICECNSLIKTMNQRYHLNFTCDIQNIAVNVPNFEAWIGCYNNSKGKNCEVGISPHCYRGFCKNTIPQWKSGSADICIDSRHDALCGSCIGNYSTVFGSNKCFLCSDWSLFTILFYAAAGLLIIFLLFSVELTISTGTLNGLIFFANIWNTGFSEILEYQNSWFGLSQVYIALLNLGVGYPLCFYDGMKEIEKSWLQLVFPVYLLVLVALVVIVSRYSMRVSSLVYSRAVPVLVTVVHLSVSRLFLAAVDAFSVGLIYTDSNINDKPRYVWLRDGTITYFSFPHALLAIISLALAAVFILPYLILLLGARWWIKFKMINLYLKPILDAAHGPFKDDKQYWFGLRLILLLQQLIVFVAVGEYSETYVYWVNGPILMVFTIMHASAQPFKSKAVNMLDGLIMIVLCLVVFACSVFALKDNLYLTELVTLSSLATVVFLVFMVILSYHILLVVLLCCSKHLKSSFATKTHQYLASFISYTDTYQPVNNYGDEWRPTTPQFREPLLDMSYGSTNSS